MNFQKAKTIYLSGVFLISGTCIGVNCLQLAFHPLTRMLQLDRSAGPPLDFDWVFKGLVWPVSIPYEVYKYTKKYVNKD